ncbi:unnamed protein product [Amoebophrya sp. A25]|nr:unnamed protein product [Amoebophrya sp. A25]|eukprot:GSA25T00022747001.1
MKIPSSTRTMQDTVAPAMYGAQPEAFTTCRHRTRPSRTVSEVMLRTTTILALSTSCLASGHFATAEDAGNGKMAVLPLIQRRESRYHYIGASSFLAVHSHSREHHGSPQKSSPGRASSTSSLSLLEQTSDEQEDSDTTADEEDIEQDPVEDSEHRPAKEFAASSRRKSTTSTSSGNNDVKKREHDHESQTTRDYSSSTSAKNTATSSSKSKTNGKNQEHQGGSRRRSRDDLDDVAAEETGFDPAQYFGKEVDSGVRIVRTQEAIDSMKVGRGTTRPHQRGATGSAGMMLLENIADMQYMAEVEVGTRFASSGDCEDCLRLPQAKMRVILDTGSSDIWINAEKCNEDGSFASEDGEDTGAGDTNTAVSTSNAERRRGSARHQHHASLSGRRSSSSSRRNKKDNPFEALFGGAAQGPKCRAGAGVYEPELSVTARDCATMLRASTFFSGSAGDTDGKSKHTRVIIHDHANNSSALVQHAFLNEDEDEDAEQDLEEKEEDVEHVAASSIVVDDDEQGEEHQEEDALADQVDGEASEDAASEDGDTTEEDADDVADSFLQVATSGRRSRKSGRTKLSRTSTKKMLRKHEKRAGTSRASSNTEHVGAKTRGESVMAARRKPTAKSPQHASNTTTRTSTFRTSNFSTSDDFNPNTIMNKFTDDEIEQICKIGSVFGSGILTGTRGFDDVKLGPITVFAQGFNMIQKHHGEIFNEIDLDGIFGLSFPSLVATTPVETEVDGAQVLLTRGRDYFRGETSLLLSSSISSGSGTSSSPSGMGSYNPGTTAVVPGKDLRSLMQDLDPRELPVARRLEKIREKMQKLKVDKNKQENQRSGGGTASRALPSTAKALGGSSKNSTISSTSKKRSDHERHGSSPSKGNGATTTTKHAVEQETKASEYERTISTSSSSKEQNKMSQRLRREFELVNDLATPFFDNVMQSNRIPNEFSFYLSRAPRQNSIFTMGGIMREAAEGGTLHTFPVVHQRYWALGLDDVTIAMNSPLEKDGLRSVLFAAPRREKKSLYRMTVLHPKETSTGADSIGKALSDIFDSLGGGGDEEEGQGRGDDGSSSSGGGQDGGRERNNSTSSGSGQSSEEDALTKYFEEILNGMMNGRKGNRGSSMSSTKHSHHHDQHSSASVSEEHTSNSAIDVQRPWSMEEWLGDFFGHAIAAALTHSRGDRSKNRRGHHFTTSSPGQASEAELTYHAEPVLTTPSKYSNALPHARQKISRRQRLAHVAAALVEEVLLSGDISGDSGDEHEQATSSSADHDQSPQEDKKKEQMLDLVRHYLLSHFLPENVKKAPLAHWPAMARTSLLQIASKVQHKKENLVGQVEEQGSTASTTSSTSSSSSVLQQVHPEPKDDLNQLRAKRVAHFLGAALQQSSIVSNRVRRVLKRVALLDRGGALARPRPDFTDDDEEEEESDDNDGRGSGDDEDNKNEVEQGSATRNNATTEGAEPLVKRRSDDDDQKSSDKKKMDAHPIPLTVNNLIVDSGTSLFTVPKHVYKTLKELLPDRTCDDVAFESTQYGNLTFWLKDVQGQVRPLTLTHDDYMIATAVTPSAKDQKNPEPHELICSLAFTPLDIPKESIPGGAIVAGMPFMRRFYSVFNRGGPSMTGQHHRGSSSSSQNTHHGPTISLGVARPDFQPAEAMPYASGHMSQSAQIDGMLRHPHAVTQNTNSIAGSNPVKQDVQDQEDEDEESTVDSIQNRISDEKKERKIYARTNQKKDKTKNHVHIVERSRSSRRRSKLEGRKQEGKMQEGKMQEDKQRQDKQEHGPKKDSKALLDHESGEGQAEQEVEEEDAHALNEGEIDLENDLVSVPDVLDGDSDGEEEEESSPERSDTDTTSEDEASDEHDGATRGRPSKIVSSTSSSAATSVESASSSTMEEELKNDANEDEDDAEQELDSPEDDAGQREEHQNTALLEEQEQDTLLDRDQEDPLLEQDQELQQNLRVEQPQNQDVVPDEEYSDEAAEENSDDDAELSSRAAERLTPKPRRYIRREKGREQ